MALSSKVHYFPIYCFTFAERFSVGQNIAEWPQNPNGKRVKVEDFVKLWYDEVKKFNPSGIEKYVFKSATAHYTQLVWAETTKIGCGYTDYLKGKYYIGFLVCDYGPSGNVKGGQIYETR